jgi:hypothetical protein
VKAYIIITGVIFAGLTVAHLLRVITENAHLAREPLFMIITVLSAGLSLWAVLILRRLKG